MNCRQMRKAWSAGERDGRVDGHLAACAECRRFTERLGVATELLRQPRSRHTAPPDFARRVVSRLETTDDPLRWAALRLLPATVALVALLSWLNLQASEPTIESEAVADVWVGWVLQPDGGDR